MNEAPRFAGRTLFVTGGGSGIGEATARRFAAEGANVVIADLDADGARRVAADLPGSLAVGVDVTDPVAVEASIAQAVAQFGRIDVVFNNAGIGGAYEPLHEATLDNWHAVNAVNADGMFHVLKFGLAALMRSGGGAIVNMASVAGLVATSRNFASYIFTKSGIVGITRAAAVDYAASGIRVNAVAPAMVLTPLIETTIAAAADPAADRERRGNLNPMPGFILPRDVAAAVAFLASDDARFITGICLPIDGGYVAR